MSPRTRREFDSRPPLIRLAQNEGIFGPFAEAQQAIVEETSIGHRYPESDLGSLRRAIGARYGMPIERVFVAGGSTAVIHYLSMCLLGPGDEVVFGAPTFGAYRLEAMKQGATAVPVPVTAAGSHDLPGLLAAVTPRTKLAYVTNPNNPTGAMVTRQALREFLTALPEHVLPVIDEAYFEYVDEPDYPDSIREFCTGSRPVVVTRTFSKIFGLAGLRVGFGILPAELTRAALKMQVRFEVNRLGVAAALATLAAPEQEILVRRRATAAGRHRLVAELRGLGFEPKPSVANFVQVPVGDARAVAATLELEGVLIRPLGSWGAPDSIRVTVGTPYEVDRFLDAFTKVAKEIA